MKQQTAVEWLYEQMSDKQPNWLYVTDTKAYVQKLWEEAKQIEADRLKSAFIAGYAEGYMDGECLHIKDAESAAHEWEYLNNK